MSDSKILLAVNGTLMRGLKLNPNMLAVNAEFVREDKRPLLPLLEYQRRSSRNDSFTG